MRKKKVSEPYTVIPIDGVEVVFNSKEDLINTFIARLEEEKMLKALDVDEDGEVLRASGVSLDDLSLLSAIAKGDSKALGYLLFKYKKDDEDLHDLMSLSSIREYKLNPIAKPDVKELKIKKLVESFPEDVKVKIDKDVLGSWDAISVGRLKNDLVNFKVLKDHISAGIFDTISTKAKSKKIKSTSLIPDIDNYMLCVNEFLSEMDEDVAEEIAEESRNNLSLDIELSTPPKLVNTSAEEIASAKQSSMEATLNARLEELTQELKAFKASAMATVVPVTTPSKIEVSAVIPPKAKVTSTVAESKKKAPPKGIGTSKAVSVAIHTPAFSELEIIDELVNKRGVSSNIAQINAYFERLVEESIKLKQ